MQKLITFLIVFRRTKQHWSIELEKVAEKYGPVFTIWMGTIPLIIISDIDIAREEFQKICFAGRPKDVFSKKKILTIIFDKYSEHWLNSFRFKSISLITLAKSKS